MSEIKVLIPTDVANLQLPDPELLTYYKGLTQRTIWIDEEIDKDCLEYIKQIHLWNLEDSQAGLPIEKRQPIKIMFYSYGGDLDIHLSLIDAITLSMTPVYGYNMGVACSAAALIYLSCHKRYCLPSAYFLLHRGSVGPLPEMSYNELIAAIDDYKDKVENFIQFIEEKTHIPHEVLIKELAGDWYIPASEALKWGICDTILVSMDEA